MSEDIDYGFDASAIHPDKLLAKAEALMAEARALQASVAATRAAMRRIEMEHAAKTPVDRSAVVLTTGSPLPDDGSHLTIEPSGMQKGYVVLSDAERGKGFVRPYRDAYRHLKCGAITTMGRSIAETYARDPTFYNGTFCSTCRTHFPVGELGEFTWYEMDGREGPKVGT